MRVALALTLLVAGIAATFAEAGVSIVDRIDLEEAAREGAVGLSVPGAGPTVTRESALNTLLTGEVESSLVGGTPPGPPKLVLGSPEPPDVRVVLPPEQRTRNDERYPIALEGRSGTVLTSDSTRIDGLVSLADFANGRVRTVPAEDPVALLERLDDRIDRNAAIRLTLTLALVAAALASALVAPRWAPRLILLALAANLWLAGWWVVAALSLAALVLPLGLACAVVLGGYLAALALDPEAVALSPFGPSQAGRFYGLSNLLATLLLVPAVLGPSLLRRTGPLLAAAALVMVGSNRLGADGGGLLVLLAAYAVLAVRLAGLRPTVRLLGVVAAGAIALGLALVGLDALLGGSSHVTDTLADGPGAALDALGTRLEASVERASASIGAALATATGLSGLVFLLTRRGRGPVTDALLAAVAVSLVVNDTPTDVASVGATLAFVAYRFECGSPRVRSAWVDRLRSMRRSTLAASTLAAAFALAVAGCGGEEVGATPEAVEGEIPTQTEPGADLPALDLDGDAANGESIYAAQGCGACHTFAPAGSSGNIGPNLDDSQPTYELAVDRVTLGRGGMPSFGDKLQSQEIADVSAFVSSG